MPFTGIVEFTSGEVTAHASHVPTIVAAARGYLNAIWEDHLQFFGKYGISRYYGDRNSALDDPKERVVAVMNAGAPAEIAKQLKPISCVGLARDALRAGFHASQDPVLGGVVKKIEAYSKANDLDGSAVIDALQRLGWRILYWNPDPSKNDAWDREDGERKSRGWHAERYRTVKKSGRYYFNRVDDSELLVGFGTSVPTFFASIPFFVGVAHTGYHVFPGHNGWVIEAHSMRPLTSRDNLERSPFNPLEDGGGPRWTKSERYRSGLMCVPPGSC